MERATTTEGTGTGPGTDVDAAVARWAAAAGVPTSVAQGYESRTPAATRFLRGVLMGGAVGLPMLALASLDGPSDGLWLVLALAVTLLGLRIARQRGRSD